MRHNERYLYGMIFDNLKKLERGPDSRRHMLGITVFIFIDSQSLK